MCSGGPLDSGGCETSISKTICPSTSRTRRSRRINPECRFSILKNSSIDSPERTYGLALPFRKGVLTGQPGFYTCQVQPPSFSTVLFECRRPHRAKALRRLPKNTLAKLTPIRTGLGRMKRPGIEAEKPFCNMAEGRLEKSNRSDWI